MARARAYVAALGIVGLGAMLLAGTATAEEKPAATAEKAPVDKEGFRPLLSGKDLAGWKADDEAKKHWVVADGVIKYDGKNKDLWSQETFGDFILKVDWRIAGNADSGIYLRGSSKSQVNIWTDALGSGEVYGYRTDTKMSEEVRKGVTPKKKADKPIGEWNSFLITMKGDRLTVVLNGEEVISNAQLPGVKATGPIALQHHGNPIDFRNVSIKELSEPAPAAAPKKEGQAK